MAEDQQARVEPPEVELNFMLIGKTGQGKSATGNLILDRQAFKISPSTSSVTKDVKDSFAKFGRYKLQVVDGPGLEDTNMDKVKDKETAIKHMDKALALCDGGVDAFLLVTKFGCRFTEEDRSVLDSLKAIFGDSFMKHVIVVVTCGDQFQSEMEGQKLDITFDQWCNEQEGAFRQLYDDCGGWFVLFNNREKEEKKKRAQMQQIVQYAYGLQKRSSRYTSQCFDDAKNERDRLITEMNAPQLKKEIQEKVSLLAGTLEKISHSPSDNEKENIRTGINDVNLEIDIVDKGTGILQDMRDTLEQIEEAFDDVHQLHVLAEHLESTREATESWSTLGAVCAVVAGGVVLASSPAVALGLAAVVGAGAVISGIGRFFSN